MPHLSMLGLGCLLLLVQTVFSKMFVHPFMPSLLLPLAIHMGISPAYQLALGASCVFVLGYLSDSFSGSPMGLQTFVLVATFLIARVAGLKFSMRRVGIQFMMSFIAALLCGSSVILLQTIFSNPMPFRASGAWMLLWLLAMSSFSVAVCAPMIFILAQSIESRSSSPSVLR